MVVKSLYMRKWIQVLDTRTTAGYSRQRGDLTSPKQSELKHGLQGHLPELSQLIPSVPPTVYQAAAQFNMTQSFIVIVKYYLYVVLVGVGPKQCKRRVSPENTAGSQYFRGMEQPEWLPRLRKHRLDICS